MTEPTAPVRTNFIQKLEHVQAYIWGPTVADANVPVITEQQAGWAFTDRTFEDNCSTCGMPVMSHGFLGDQFDPQIIHPGDYAVDSDLLGFHIMPNGDFLSKFEPLAS